ncbi:hypothetical protein WKK05_40765 (plasmid) [Nostoc sp. UHCC 0302]|uniref:hypothetical protein n=1 Tax=Nostoc sp. UHCC 0302 TaxID=3134896 RepID=UPI00311C8A0E
MNYSTLYQSFIGSTLPSTNRTPQTCTCPQSQPRLATVLDIHSILAHYQQPQQHHRMMKQTFGRTDQQILAPDSFSTSSPSSPQQLHSSLLLEEACRLNTGMNYFKNLGLSQSTESCIEWHTCKAPFTTRKQKGCKVLI